MTYFIINSNCHTLQFILPYATLKNGIETLLRHLIGLGHFNGMFFLLYFNVHDYLGFGYAFFLNRRDIRWSGSYCFACVDKKIGMFHLSSSSRSFQLYIFTAIQGSELCMHYFSFPNKIEIKWLSWYVFNMLNKMIRMIFQRGVFAS